RILASPELVPLGADERGRERFTSRDLIRAQEAMLRVSDRLEGQPHHAIAERSGRAARAEMAALGRPLGDEQVVAVAHVLSAGCLAAIVGYAGTGKSIALSVARAAWE